MLFLLLPQQTCWVRFWPFNFSKEQQKAERSQGKVQSSMWRDGVTGAQRQAETKLCKLICCHLRAEPGSQNSPHLHVNVRRQKCDIVWKLNTTVFRISCFPFLTQQSNHVARSPVKISVVICLKELLRNYFYTNCHQASVIQSKLQRNLEDLESFFKCNFFCM